MRSRSGRCEAGQVGETTPCSRALSHCSDARDETWSSTPPYKYRVLEICLDTVPAGMPPGRGRGEGELSGGKFPGRWELQRQVNALMMGKRVHVDIVVIDCLLGQRNVDLGISSCGHGPGATRARSSSPTGEERPTTSGPAASYPTVSVSTVRRYLIHAAPRGDEVNETRTPRRRPRQQVGGCVGTFALYLQWRPLSTTFPPFPPTLLWLVPEPLFFLACSSQPSP